MTTVGLCSLSCTCTKLLLAPNPLADLPWTRRLRLLERSLYRTAEYFTFPALSVPPHEPADVHSGCTRTFTTVGLRWALEGLCADDEGALRNAVASSATLIALADLEAPVVGARWSVSTSVWMPSVVHVATDLVTGQVVQFPIDIRAGDLTTDRNTVSRVGDEQPELLVVAAALLRTTRDLSSALLLARDALK